MPHKAAFQLGLHCLQKYLFMVSRMKRVNIYKPANDILVLISLGQSHTLDVHVQLVSGPIGA